jgi:hypothetical protein
LSIVGGGARATFGGDRDVSPAEALIELLQTQAKISELTGPYQLGDNLFLPVAAAQGRTVMFGKSECGKSNGSAVTIENCFVNNVPVSGIDQLGNQWGIRYEGSRPGLPIPIIGGLRGDLPLTADDGDLLGRIFAQGTSMLLDISLLPTEEQQAFGTAFLDELNRSLRQPAHVVLEEAEKLCPAYMRSRAAFEVQGVASLFIRQIRNFGVGWTLSTQSAGLLLNDAIHSANVFIAMQTTGDDAQRAIGKDAKTRVGKVIAGAILNELGRLGRGEAWLIPDPQWLGGADSAPFRFKFRKRWTFDSTEVPKIGEKLKDPGEPADVDLRPFEELRRRHRDGDVAVTKARPKNRAARRATKWRS